jgi:hypothetical protein
MDKKRRLVLLSVFIVATILVTALAINSYIKRLPFTSDGKGIIIKIERWPCFGRCPVYIVTVYGSGLVIYDGKLSVDAKGKRIKFLNEEEISTMLTEFEKAEFFALDDNYAFHASDLPATIIQIEIDGQSKRIWHCSGGCGSKHDVAPPELCKLESQLDEIVDVKNWVKGNK